MKSDEFKNFWYKTNIIIPLRGFCKVYENGSFSAAAKELNVSQSTITRQIQAIEREIKTQLFDKTASGKIEPTKDGKFFYEIVKPKIQSLDYIYEYFFLREDLKHDNTIRLSCHHAFIANVLPYCIHRYKQENNGDNFVKFLIKDSDFVKALDDLDNNEVDIAIYPVENFPDDKRYNEAKYTVDNLFEFNPVIVLHKNNSLAKKDSDQITIDDLRKQNVLLIDKGKMLSNYTNMFEYQNITGNLIFENSDWETLKNFVRLNLGIQFYSSIQEVLKNHVEIDLVTKDVSHLFPKMEAKLIRKKGFILNQYVDKFLKIINEISMNFKSK